jgi:hypothetical protein
LNCSALAWRYVLRRGDCAEFARLSCHLFRH